MKIAILGAAGVRTPLIVQAMANRQDTLGLTELVLMDIDAERLQTIGELTAPIEESGQLSFRIHRTLDAREALSGADYVITTFRVGGMAARVIDERVPLRYGILGQETTGPGGFAMAMRTIPVLAGYIKIMREVCPDAWLINFANPAGMMAEAILRALGWKRAAGICDAPSSMQRVAAALLGVGSNEIFLDYFGLNHLGWVRSVIYRGEDVLPEFLATMSQAGGFPDLPFTSELILALGMVPNEYLYYYYSTRQSVQNILRSEQTRGEQLLELNDRLFADLQHLRASQDREGMLQHYQAYLHQRGETYMRTETGHTREENKTLHAAIEAASDGGYAGVALDLIEGLNGAGARVMTLNIQNHGAIDGMADEDVVEIPAFVGNGMIRPMAVGKIPDAALGLMKQVKAYERLTIAAAIEGSYLKAAQALTLHPLVSDERLAHAILDDYIAQHGSFFPALH